MTFIIQLLKCMVAALFCGPGIKNWKGNVISLVTKIVTLTGKCELVAKLFVELT